MPKSVVVAGHVCLDVIPRIEHGFDLRPGRLYEVGAAMMATGGAVANVGLALHLLGTPTVLMGKVGRDSFGQTIVDIFRRHDEALARGMKVDPAVDTSYSVVINIPGRDRTFLHCCGANHTYTAADIDYDEVRRADLFHFGYPPLMAATYANAGEQLVQLFSRVKAGGTITSLDMAMPDPDGPSGKADWQALLRNVLPHVDIFLPSANELLFMIDRAELDVGDNLNGAQLGGLGDRLLELGVAIAGIKLGERGLYLRTANAERLAAVSGLDAAHWADRELWFPVVEVPEVVGATGAGDCTIAGFLASLLRGLGPEAAGATANMVGAMNVQAADAISGLGDWETTQRALATARLVPLRHTGDGWQQASSGVWRGPRDTI